MNTAMSNPKVGDRREPKILDDLHVLPCRELAEQKRDRDEERGESNEAVQHLVADRLLEDVHRDVADVAHDACQLPATRTPNAQA